jgi:hypothetical protein
MPYTMSRNTVGMYALYSVAMGSVSVQNTAPVMAPLACAGRSTLCMSTLVISKNGNLIKLVDTVVLKNLALHTHTRTHGGGSQVSRGTARGLCNAHQSRVQRADGFAERHAVDENPVDDGFCG